MAAILAGTYWSARQETRLECAHRISRALATIAKQHELLENWFQCLESQGQPLIPIEKTPEAIDSRITAHRRNMTGIIIPELGFHFSAWNGNLKFPAKLSIRCGIYSAKVVNRALLNFQWTEAESSLSPELLRTLFERFIEIWEPDKAVVISLDELKAASTKMPWEVKSLLSYQKC